MQSSVSQTFRALVTAFNHDATAPTIDVLAAEFAAQVGAFGHTVCLRLVRPDVVARYYGFVYFLAGYGITLRYRQRSGGEGVFIYASVTSEAPKSDFQRATVKAVRRSHLTAALSA